MNRQNRSSLVAGLLLIILGGWFLATRFIPGLEQWSSFSWPWIVIGVGAAMLVLGLAAGAPGMAIPAAIVGGIGGILYYQNATGDWKSWSYLWSLIPGFVGVGILLSALAGGDERREAGEGLRLIIISAVLFLIFGAFLGGPRLLGDWWPVLLVLAGLYLLFRDRWPFRRQ